MKNFKFSPHESLKVPEKPAISKFADLRAKDLSDKDFKNIPIKILNTIDFDSQTKFPPAENLPAEFNPRKLMENGKNPGLGIRELHREGITGKGINVAIIDQKLDLTHPEYAENIIGYEEVGDSFKNNLETISMHGPAVASLLIGKDCGVAPDAKLYYKAAPAGEYCHWEDYAESLNKIIEHNNSADEQDKIKIVSCSIGYPNPGPKGDLNIWIQSIEKAKSGGIIFIDARTLGHSNFSGGGSLDDKENIDRYHAWLYFTKQEISATKDSAIVPTDYRTVASSWNKINKNDPTEYYFNGRGGVSWAVPYLAGICALMLQVNKDLKMEEMFKIIHDTATVNKKGLKIINPRSIIETVKNQAPQK